MSPGSLNGLGITAELNFDLEIQGILHCLDKCNPGKSFTKYTPEVDCLHEAQEPV